MSKSQSVEYQKRKEATLMSSQYLGLWSTCQQSQPLSHHSFTSDSFLSWGWQLNAQVKNRQEIEVRVGMNRVRSLGEQAETEHNMVLEVRDYGHHDDDAYSVLCIVLACNNISIIS